MTGLSQVEIAAIDALSEDLVRSRKIEQVLTGRSFVAVKMDDGSIGTAMDYSHYPRAGHSFEVVTAHDADVAEYFERGGDLLASLERDVPSAAPLAARLLATRVAILSALAESTFDTDSPAATGYRLIPASYEDQRASDGRGQATRLTAAVVAEAEAVGVVGFGGFMEIFAGLRSVRKVLVADLHFTHRKRAIEQHLEQLNSQYGTEKIQFVGDSLDRLAKECSVVQLTGSGLCNGSIDQLLDRFSGHRLIVAGPSAALPPSAWFQNGVSLLCTERRDDRYLHAYRYDPHLYEWFAEYDQRIYAVPGTEVDSVSETA